MSKNEQPIEKNRKSAAEEEISGVCRVALAKRRRTDLQDAFFRPQNPAVRRLKLGLHVPHPKLRSRPKKDSGFTMVEVVVVLSVLVVLAFLILPQIRGFVIEAQRVRAHNDLASLSNALLLMVRDVGAHTLAGPDDDSDLTLLVSNGDIAAPGPGGDNRWASAIDGWTVDFLEYYLVTNTPGGDPSRRLPTPRDGAGRFAWRGAYLSGPLNSDPWGNRYMVNIGFLNSGGDEDVVVLSAGPNEMVETGFAEDGLVPGGDDLLVVFSADRRGNGW